MIAFGLQFCKIVELKIISDEFIIAYQETTSNPRRTSHHRYKEIERSNRNRTGNKSGGSTAGNSAVELAEKDKYYEEDDDYFYEEYEQIRNTTGEYDDEEEDKFVESGNSGIVLDHVDFVLLRLKHISARVSSNITDILALQKKEFKVNSAYKKGWDWATRIFNSSKRAVIFKNTTKYSIVRQVPVEYHIAIILYTSEDPNVYREFNKDTREICSGNHIDDYKWKSYFKLLQLAVETLGSREARWVDQKRFLYRGASIKYSLKEGQILAFQHFISTSAALTTAELFAGKTLFEFQGFYNGTAMAVWDHSVVEGEYEVLFSPTQIFEVDSIHVGHHYTRVVLVKHEQPLPCDKKSEMTEDNADLDKTNALARAGSGMIYGSVQAVAFLASFLIIFQER